jgi:hypothetical protein
MPDSERIVVEVDEGPAVQSVGKANAAMESFEGRTVRVMERSRSSVDRLVASLEKQSAVYGKSGVDRIIAERDQLLQRYAKEPAAIDAITRAYEKMAAAAKQAAAQSASVARAAPGVSFRQDPATDSGTGFSFRYAFFGLKDLAEGRTKFALAEAANELVRLRGAALAVGGSIAAVAGLGLAVYGVVHGLKELRDGPINIDRAFRELNGTIEHSNDELRLENDRLANTIAKLEHRPENHLKIALDESRISADRLAESLEKDAKKLQGLLKENAPGILDRLLFGQRGTGDIEDWSKAYERMLGDLNAVGSRNVHLATTPEQAQKAQDEWDVALAAARRSALQKIRGQIEETQKPVPPPVLPKGQAGIVPGGAFSGPLFGAGSIFSPDDERVLRDARLRTLRQVERYLLEQGSTASLLTDQAKLKGRLPDAETAARLQDVLRERDKQLSEARAESGQFDQSPFTRSLREYQKLRVDDQELAKADLKYHSEKLTALDAELARQLEANALDKVALEAKKQAEEYSRARGAARTEELKGQLKRFDFAHELRPADIHEWMEQFTTQREIENIGIETQRSTTNALANRAFRLSELATGNDRQLGIDRSYAIRVQLAQRLHDIELDRVSRETEANKKAIETAKAQADLQKGLFEAQLQQEVELAQLQHDRMEKLKSSIVGVLDVLFNKPKDFPAALGNTIKQAFLKPIEEGLAGSIGKSLSPLIYGGDGNGGIAGSLRNLFGVQKPLDPIKISTDLNTSATEGLSARLAGGVGSGAGSAFRGGAGAASLASLLAISAGGGGARSVGGEIIGAGSAAAAGLARLPNGLVDRAGGFGMSPADRSWFDYVSGFSGGGGGAIGGSSRGAGFLGGINLNALRSSFFNSGSIFGPAGYATTAAGIGGLKGSLAGVLTSPGAGALMTAVGAPLALSGLIGDRQGTLGGILRGAGGGALLGAGIGTMILPGLGTAIGAGIGAVAGLTTGLIEKLVGTKRTQAHDQIKSLYGIDVPANSGTMKQILQIVDQNFGGSISVGIRSPQVRDLLSLYSLSTGGRPFLDPNTPRAGYFGSSGGNIYQTPGYASGYAYALPSSFAPSAASQPYPAPYGATTVQLSQAGTRDFLNGQRTTISSLALAPNVTRY